MVKLLTAPPDPSIPLRLGFAKVFLPKAELRQWIDDATALGGKWKTEEERQTLLRGSRAEALLQIVERAGGSGQLIDEKQLSREVRYVIAELLESGSAAVQSLRGEFVATLDVHYRGVLAGPRAGFGNISFGSSEAGPLLMIDWWVS